jgi:hypothetical protein
VIGENRNSDGVLLENPKERDYLEDIGAGFSIILK